jgi:hypothetical protein
MYFFADLADHPDAGYGASLWAQGGALGKVQAAGNFRYFETYNMVALLYLVMTIGLSLGLRRIEARLKMHTK